MAQNVRMFVDVGDSRLSEARWRSEPEDTEESKTIPRLTTYGRKNIAEGAEITSASVIAIVRASVIFFDLFLRIVFPCLRVTKPG